MESTMTTNSDRASAKIFQFPPRGRFAAADQSDEKPVISTAASHVAKVAVGGAWYHDEAIRESESTSDR
jgi:hypothetical protein